ncbi:MAG: hypothetical protein ACOC7S_00670 [Planctomycetota bacterium]
MKTSALRPLIVCVVYLALLGGCGDDGAERERERQTYSELSRSKMALAEREAELGRTKAALAEREGQLGRAEERLSAAEARSEELAAELALARRRAEAGRSETRAAESDFLVAMGVAFACVVALLLLAHLLVGERRSRKALSALLGWIRRGAGP